MKKNNLIAKWWDNLMINTDLNDFSFLEVINAIYNLPLSPFIFFSFIIMDF